MMDDGQDYFEIDLGRHYPPLRYPRALTPETGFPTRGLPEPICEDGTFDRTTYLAREAFLTALYTDAPDFLLELHQAVYPLYESYCQKRHFRPIPPHIKRISPEILFNAPLTFSDLDATNDSEAKAIKSAILATLGQLDLWREWFITFVLYLMHARFLNLLTQPPRASELIEHARRVTRGQRNELGPGHTQVVTYHERFDFNITINFWDVGEREFADLKAQIDRAVDQEIKRFKEHHHKVRKAFLADERKATRSIERYGWLVRRLILGETYEDIASALHINKDLSAVAKGVAKAAKELDISLEPVSTALRK